MWDLVLHPLSADSLTHPHSTVLALTVSDIRISIPRPFAHRQGQVSSLAGMHILFTKAVFRTPFFLQVSRDGTEKFLPRPAPLLKYSGTMDITLLAWVNTDSRPMKTPPMPVPSIAGRVEKDLNT